MEKYEIMYIIRPDLDEESQNGVVERANQLLTDNGAEVTEVKDMGKRRLAYEIKDYREGVYKVIYTKADSKALDEFDRLMKINDDMIRFMIVRDERED
ncbi:MAG TPA: 30S ribosomal protein S6 [Bacillales bacterium]